MITEERKIEIIADIEYHINRFIDKQGILEDIKRDLYMNPEELIFIKELDGCYCIFKEAE